jgi:acetyl-CoA carboxylase biotin carboxylase subunit
MGDKLSARKCALEAKVDPVPGVMQGLGDVKALSKSAKELGYPVMLKASAGGGGKGIRIISQESELEEGLSLARAEAMGAFGDDTVYLEKFVNKPRHVEVQIMGDRHGRVVAYGERECSVQRRHQKLVEESPSPALDEKLREQICASAVRLGEAVSYVGAGTVEYLYSEGSFYFLEMNTRLQVEHPITEMRFGADLVKEQFRVAAGEHARDPLEPRGHAIEVRINAEDPETFFPSLGKIQRLLLPGGTGVRMDSCLYRGLEVSPYYDSMLAKLVVHAEDRPGAIARMLRALRELRIVGVESTVPIAVSTLESAEFCSGEYDTGILERIDSAPDEDMLEIASLAAALNGFLRTESVDVDGGAGSGQPEVSPWTRLGRMEGLGGGGLGR